MTPTLIHITLKAAVPLITSREILDQIPVDLHHEIRKLMSDDQQIAVFSHLLWWFDKSDRVMQDTPYLDGQRHGVSTSYHSNGNVCDQLTYAHGVKEGMFKKFYPDGRLLLHGNNHEGKYHGRHLRYNYKGDWLRDSEEYVNGQLHGTATCFFPNGKPSFRSEYVNGKKHGKQLYYYNNGKVSRAETYMNGKKVHTDWYRE